MLKSLPPEQLLEVDSLPWWHSIPLAEDYTTRGRSGANIRYSTTQWGVPEDLTGKRILDVGCWDGGFSFECEQRGAKVEGIDIWQGFNLWNDPLYSPRKIEIARRILKSEIYYRTLDVIDAADFFGEGSFDIVLCFGVLYHVKSPMLAIESMTKIARELICVETVRTDGEHWKFSPRYNNDPTIYWIPSYRSLCDVFSFYGWSDAEMVSHGDDRMACTFRKG